MIFSDSYDDIGVDGPYSEFCERACIGACLVNAGAFRDVCAVLEPNHFWKPLHREAFRSVKKIYVAGTTADLESVRVGMSDQGLKSEQIEEVLLDMAENFAYLVGEIGRHIQIIQEKWVLRQFIALGRDCNRRNAQSDKALSWVKKIEEGSISGLAETGLIGDFMDFKRKSGILSAFKFINESTVTCGWPEGQMHVIAAYRGGGKTAIMLQDAAFIAANIGPVAYGTFADLDREDVAKRLMKNATGFSVEPPETADWGRWLDAEEDLKKLQFHVYDATKNRAGRDIEGWAAWVRRTHEQRGLKCAYLDYAQKAKTRKHTSSPLESLTEVSDVCQWLAAETKIPVIVGSQVTLGSEKMGTLDKTKGGLVLEDDAALVLRLKIYKEPDRLKLDPPYNTVPGATLLHLDKNRFGESDLSRICQWQSRFAKFVEIDSDGY